MLLVILLDKKLSKNIILLHIQLLFHLIQAVSLIYYLDILKIFSIYDYELNLIITLEIHLLEQMVACIWLHLFIVITYFISNFTIIYNMDQLSLLEIMIFLSFYLFWVFSFRFIVNIFSKIIAWSIFGILFNIIIYFFSLSFLILYQ